MTSFDLGRSYFDLVPTEEYTAEDARRAARDARYVVGQIGTVFENSAS